jgi:hypothetical protein
MHAGQEAFACFKGDQNPFEELRFHSLARLDVAHESLGDTLVLSIAFSAYGVEHGVSWDADAGELEAEQAVPLWVRRGATACTRFFWLRTNSAVSIQHRFMKAASRTRAGGPTKHALVLMRTSTAFGYNNGWLH